MYVDFFFVFSCYEIYFIVVSFSYCDFILVSYCTNNGSVEGDMYVGGITGTMGIEYEFDMEGVIHSAIQNLTEKEEISAVTYQTKCLCISNVNNAHIASKKQCAGGISGESNVGIISECENYGNVESDSGQYVGGIAGKSSTVINNCCSMCALFGEEYVGGIAGFGKDISGCSSLIKIEGVTACCGAIAGYVNLNDESTVENNTFVSDDLQGIDGISYEGIAQKVDYLEFTENRELPRNFKKLSVSFIADEEIVKQIEVKYGEAVDADLVPQVPEKAGFTGKWEEFDKSIKNSCEVHAIYVRKKDTVESEIKRDGTERPLFILSGDFEEGTQLLVEKYTHSLPERKNSKPVEAWKVTLDGTDANNEINMLRYYIPQNLKKYSLFCLNENSEWIETQFEDFGNYAGISMPEREIVICSVEKTDFWSKWKSVMN